MKYKLLFLLPLLCTSCQKADKTNTIFASFDAIRCLASNIIGDKYNVESIVPSGTEPHDFELTAEMLAYLSESKGLLINGFNFEHWTNNLPSDIKNKMFDVSNGVEPQYIDGKLDPHIWLNPLNAITEMENIAYYITTTDEKNHVYYVENLEQAKLDFIALDKECLEKAKNFTNKNIVVSHAAYGYMCERYGLNQIYINGIEPDQEPSSKTLAEIIDKVKELNITTIFTEELISKDIAEKIAQETGVKIEMLNTLEVIKDGQDYISLMKENFTKLEKACK